MLVSNYTANRYELNATHASRLEDISGETRNHSTDVTISSALAFCRFICDDRQTGAPKALLLLASTKALAKNDVAVEPSKKMVNTHAFILKEMQVPWFLTLLPQRPSSQFWSR